ncbi:MAG TPA: prepilin peptidase [Candidatus Baltobacteraceae bacterium]
MTIALALVLIASLAGAATDLRTRRVPNVLAGALLLSGLALNAFSGWQAAAIDLLIVALVIAAGTFAFSLRLIGGGDVKLLAAAAGTLGYPAGGNFLLFTLLCGGLVAIAFSALSGRLGTTFSNVRAMALPVFAGVAPARPQTGLAMPYAIAIFAGALCTALVNGFLPHLRILP